MTLALIPARGGSKGIPRKNIREIAGKPLIAWTIEAALAAEQITRVVVSTEDAEIASIAHESGADVPFMRPPELSGDEVSGTEPVLHAVETLAWRGPLVLLQPTSPLRGAGTIDAFVFAAEASGASSAVSISQVEKHPAWMYRRNADGVLDPFTTEFAARRQDLELLYALNGAMYWTRGDRLLADRTLLSADPFGFVMASEDAVDIDSPFDWQVANMLLNEMLASR